MKHHAHHDCAFAALIVSVLISASALAADNNYYNTIGDYRWFTAGNWQAGIPDNTSTVYLNTAGKTSPANPLVITSATEKAKASNLNVAWGNNETGWLEVRSDLDVAAQSIVGRGSYTFGYQKFSSGTSIYNGNFFVGHLANSTGVLEVAGGTLLVSTNAVTEFKLGENGNGFLELSSGTIRVKSGIVMGNNSGSSGTLTVSGGQLWIGTTVSHNLGTPTYRQSAGFASIGNTMTLGAGVNGIVPSQGYADISGGTLVVSNKLFAGNNGSCNWSQTGGNVWVGSGGAVFGLGVYSVVNALFDGADTIFTTPGEIYLAGGNGSVATLTQKNGALTASIFNLASKSNAVARYVLEGGSLSVSNILRVGQGGFGTFEHSGGSVFVKSNINLPLQNAEGYNFDVESVYRMTGGTLQNNGYTRLGMGGGRGKLELMGGTATFANFTFVGNGTYLGQQGRGTLVLGGEMNATFNGEATIGADDTNSRGTLHVYGGGTGERKFQANLYLRNAPTIKATIDGKGLNPVTVNGYFEVLSPVTLIPYKTPDAKPGTYTVLRYTKTLIQDPGCDFSFAPSVDTACWKFAFDTTAKTLTLTLRNPGTMVVVR